MRVSLIVSTYNSVNALQKVLAGIRGQTTLPDELLIADDGSSEETRICGSHFQKQFMGDFQHIWHEDKGFRKTIILNKAIAAANSPYIIFLDGDCVPHPRFVEDHLTLREEQYWTQGRRAFISESHVDAFTGQASQFLTLWLQGQASGFFKGVRWPLPWIQKGTPQRGLIGCNMGVWKKDLIAINGYDEEYQGWGKEDSDLGNRLYNMGLLRKTVYGRAIVYHLNHPQASRRNLSENEKRLLSVIENGHIVCRRGLSQYL
jgi:glycosyltransferase involved in cell wall biosynthesis